jgi:hypothetical protein
MKGTDMKLIALAATAAIAATTLAATPAAAHGWRWKQVCHMDRHHHRMCTRQHVRW